MFPRRQRLTKTKDIDRLYKHGERLASRFFMVRLRLSSYPHSRAVVIVSTKVEKRAVVRNQLKRHVRQVLQKPLIIYPGWDILVTVRQSIRDYRDWPMFQEELRTLLKQRFAV